MLVPAPPRAVGRRREVAAAVVAVRPLAAIEPGHVLLRRVDKPGVAPAPIDPAPAAQPALSLRVVYRWREYLAILRETLPGQLLEWERSRGKAADGRLSWPTRTALALLVPLVGTIVLWRKKSRMPVCRFSMDSHGIERLAGGERLAFAWREVRAVRRLRGAYLIDKGDGGLPLPYRCFDETGSAAFERLLLSHFPHDTPV